MPRKCFYSFHYKADSWRVSQIKQIGAIEGQPVVNANRWEEVEREGDAAIKKWIDNNLEGRTCLIVLAGAKTAGRKWVQYEIEKAWNLRMGLLAVHIHNLLDQDGRQSLKGADPFATWTVGQKPMTTWAKTYDPPSSDSKKVYDYIASNIDGWVEEAIRLRGKA